MDRRVSRVQMALPDEEDAVTAPVDRDLRDWVKILKKFNETQKEVCKNVPAENKQERRNEKVFITGSRYEGTWDNLGMSGFGTYVLSNGAVYTGEIDDGYFNGIGQLEYGSGEVMKGNWDKGRMIDRKLTFANGLEFDETEWRYCRMPDRRFTVEYENDLQPGGKTFLTAEQPTREIPEGYYDCGDGFFNPESKMVYDAETRDTIRAPSKREQKWIVENCRTAPDEAVGPRPYLYEEWSEPQLYPEPPPAPAAVSRATKFGDFTSFDSYDDTDFYVVLRKSRTSFVSTRSKSSLSHKSTSSTFFRGVKSVRSQHFRWKEQVLTLD